MRIVKSNGGVGVTSGTTTTYTITVTNNGPDQVTGAVVQDKRLSVASIARQPIRFLSRAMACRAAASPSAICQPRASPLALDAGQSSILSFTCDVP